MFVYFLIYVQSIGEVKTMAIKAFGLSIESSMCRLHIDDDADVAHIPRKLNLIQKFSLFDRKRCFVLLVYDHQAVDTIEFKQNNTNLCLKLGQAVKENFLLIYVLSDREPSSLELVVDQNLTLNDLWCLIKQELHMDGKKNLYFIKDEI